MSGEPSPYISDQSVQFFPPSAEVGTQASPRFHDQGVDTPIPSIEGVIEATVMLGRLTNPAIRCVGIAVNTERLGEAEAITVVRRLAGEYGLPATDPIRFGAEPIVDRLMAQFPA